RRRYGPDRVERAIDDTGALLAMDLRRFDVGEVMQQVRACVLHVHGRVDTLIPAGTARALAARRPRNVYLELPEDGHFSTTARPCRLPGPLGSWFPVPAATPAAATCPPVRLPADPAGILPAEPTR